MRDRPAWGFALAKSFTDPVWWFYLYWLPLYFADVRHLNLQQIAWALPVIYLMADLGSLAGGWLPGRFIQRGWDPWSARKATMAICVMFLPIAALAVFASSIEWTVLLISLGTLGHQGWSANLFTTVSDTYPTSAVGTVVGMGQCLASFAGLFVSSLLPGFLVPHFGYTPVFLLMGTLHLAGLAAVHLLMKNPKLAKGGTPERI